MEEDEEKEAPMLIRRLTHLVFGIASVPGGGGGRGRGGMSLFRIVHARGAIPNEMGPTHCRATPASRRRRRSYAIADIRTRRVGTVLLRRRRVDAVGAVLEKEGDGLLSSTETINRGGAMAPFPLWKDSRTCVLRSARWAGGGSTRTDYVDCNLIILSR